MPDTQFEKITDERRNKDRELFAESMNKIYQPVQKKKIIAEEHIGSIRTNMEDLLHYFGKELEIPKHMEGEEEILQYIMSMTGIMRRRIVLTGAWYRHGTMPLICRKRESGQIETLLPDHFGNYLRKDEKGEWSKVTKENAKELGEEAFCMYEPFENKEMTLKDFWKFLLGAFSRADIFFLLGISLTVSLLGLILPMISKFIFNEVIPSGTSDSLFGVVVLLLGATIVSELFSLSRTIWITRIGNKIEIRGQNAVWARVLNLPVDFFGKYEAGEMTRRAESIDEICSILGGQLIPSILGSLFSVLYLFQIAGIASSLLLPSLLIIICMLGFAFLDTKLQIDYMQESNRAENKLNSFVFQILGGITKIKLTGAEIRAFSKWSDLYAKLPLIPKAAMRLSGTINRVITILGTMLLYWMAYNTQMSASDYIAFQSAFGSFCAAIMMLTNVTRQIASLKPSLEMLRPIIEEKPENCTGQVRLDELSGEIELHQIKFRYQPDMPLVLDDLSVHIKAGEYIGVVGSSGSGKSTMMRLLLGFEHPESGSVYYDGKDLAGLDLHSLRQKMGVVLQNGKLFLGDIYSNIVVNAPWLTVDDAWAAAEAAGFAEDIRKMPMGMFTMLSEEGGGLSGGQKQRLLIARALAADPDILIFDEATSALDNITQAMVVKTLEKRKGTRIVIAHRLSTIMNCSRILYLHQGKIAEEGTYEELMEKKGRFYEMAKRQLA